MTHEEKMRIRMVLGFFGAEGGVEPGGFTQLLLEAYGKADQTNKYRLRLGFPEEADMMDAVMNTESGIEDLRARLAEK